MFRLVLILIASVFVPSLAFDQQEPERDECIHEHPILRIGAPVLEEHVQASQAVVRVSLERASYNSQYLDEPGYKGYYGYLHFLLRVHEWMKGTGPEYIWVHAVSKDACTFPSWTHEQRLERLHDLTVLEGAKIEALWQYASQAVLLLYHPPTVTADGSHSTYFLGQLWSLGDRYAPWRPLNDWIYNSGWIPWSSAGWLFWMEMSQGPNEIRTVSLSEIRLMIDAGATQNMSGAMLVRS